MLPFSDIAQNYVKLLFGKKKLKGENANYLHPTVPWTIIRE